MNQFVEYDDDEGFNHIQFTQLQIPNGLLIKKYSNHSAERQMRKVVKRLDYDDENSVEHFVNMWCNELSNFLHGAEIISYILTDKHNTTIGFCLLSNVLTNNPTNHKNPYLIQYIYIVKAYRHNQFGYKLLSYIQKRHSTIAITMPNSHRLFQKCNYKVGVIPKEGERKCKENGGTTDGLNMVYYP